jgi:acyl-CoA dehydrogenase
MHMAQGPWPAFARGLGRATLGGMGLLSDDNFAIGLDPGDPSGYGTIARASAALAERGGRLDQAAAWTGRQVVARFFLIGFGTAAQRAALLPRLRRGEALLAVAISEPGVGAHPKHLTTRAVADGDGVLISGRKAWVSNGPDASHFIVLAISAIDGGRKRYSAYLLARDTPGLTLRPMPELPDGRHCQLDLDACFAPREAILGPPGDAYAAMALPFRDVEDAVGLAKLAGALRHLLARLATGSPTPEATLSLGGLEALTAVLSGGAEAVVAALDAARLADENARLVGLRLLTAELVLRVRAHRAAHGPAMDGVVDRLLADLDLSLSVARGPRLARQARLGEALRG